MLVKLIVLSFFIVMFVTGCAVIGQAIDSLLLPGDDGKSAFRKGTEAAAPFLGPYGDILLLIGMVAQNGWLGVKKVQAVRNGKKNPQAA